MSRLFFARCVYACFASAAFAATASAQSTTWSGATSAAWDDASNWSNGVPSSTTDAVIASVATMPTIAVAGATAKNLTVQSGAVLTLDPGFDLHVFAALAVNSGGTLTSNGPVDVDTSVTLGAASAVWNVGSSTHTVGGAWSSTGGSAVGSGTIKFDGSGTSAVSMGAGSSISSVEVAKTAGTVLFSEGSGVTTITMTIPGALTVTSGTLQVDCTNNANGVAEGATIAVGGNFLASGGTALMTMSGVDATDFVRLDVEGDVTVLGGLLSTATSEAEVFCAGNWDTAAAGVFDPTLGLVTLDDGGTVACLANSFASFSLSNGTDTSPSTALYRRSVTINSGSVLTPTAGTTQFGTLGGTLTIASGATLDSVGVIDNDGSLSLGNATAVWITHGQTHTVAGGWSTSGSTVTDVATTIRFDGGGTSALSLGASGTINSIEVAKTSGTVLLSESAGATGTTTLVIPGSLTVTSGTLQVEYSNSGFGVTDGAQITVAGNFLQTGGTTLLTSTSAVDPPDFARLDVEGDVTVLGGVLSMTGPEPDVFCAGNWDTSAGGAFSPTLGLVTLDDGGMVTCLANSFANFTLANGTDTTLSTPLFRGSVTIGSASVLTPTAATTQFGTLGGTLTIASGGTLDSAALIDNDGSLSLGNATAAWITHGQTHTIAGNLTTSGSTITDMATTIRFDGGGTSTLSIGTGTSISNVVVAKTGGTVLLRESTSLVSTVTLAIQGSLTVTSGTLQVDYGNNLFGSADGAQITVAGDFVQTGGTTLLTSGSTADAPDFARLDVEGDFTVLGGVLSMTHIEADAFCAGNWDTSASGAFDPSLGLVTLDDGGTVTCLAESFASFTLANGTDTTLSTPLFRGSVTIGSGSVLTPTAATTQFGTLGGTLTIANGGTLDSSGVIDNDGSVSLGNATAVWITHGQTHTVAGNWTTSGSTITDMATTIRFDGGGTSTFFIGTGTSISNVEFAKTGGTVLLSELSSQVITVTLAIPGSLTVTSGTLQVDYVNSLFGSTDGAQITVAGNFVQTGGTTLLTSASSTDAPDFARLDVEGDVTVSGGVLSMATVEAEVFCAGNWDTAAAGVFDPSLGLVTLDDGGTVTCLASAFANFSLSSGTDTNSSTALYRRSVTINSGSVLTPTAGTTQVGTLGGTLTIASGATLDSAGVIDIDGSLSLGNATAVWTTHGQTHTVAGNWSTSGGSITDMSTLIRFDGGGTSAVTMGAGSSISNADVAKTAGTVLFSEGGGIATITLTITGSLMVTSGTLQVDYVNSAFAATDGAQITVAGNFVQSGGTTLLTSASSTDAPDFARLDVEGNVTISGGVLSMATVEAEVFCAGNWDTSASGVFDPTQGLVTLDDGGTVTCLASAFANFSLSSGTDTNSSTALYRRSVTINSGSVLTPTAGTTQFGTLGGTLTIASGATLDSAGVIDIDGSLSLGNATAVWTTHGQTHTVAGNWTTSGGSITDLSAVIRFDGGGTSAVTMGAGSSISNVEVAKTAGTVLFSEGGGIATITLTITGSLMVTSGTLQVDYVNSAFAATDGAQITVAGNFVQSGGTTLLTSASSTDAPDFVRLDVEGDVTISGGVLSMAHAEAEVFCAGTWTSRQSTFDPALGVVSLDANANRLIGGVSAGDVVAFNTLRLVSGAHAAANDFTLDCNSLVHLAAATLDASGSTMNVDLPVTAPWSVAGTLAVGAGGRLGLPASTLVTIPTTGILQLHGSPTAAATIAGFNGGGYTLTINGLIDASNYAFRDMGAAGVVISSTATFATAPNDMRGGTFYSPQGGPELEISRSSPLVVRYVRFQDLDLGEFNAFSPSMSAVPPLVTFVNWGGDFGGPTYESDPNGVIEWASPDQTQLAGFSATPGPVRITLDWTTTQEVDVDRFLLQRSSSPAGPWTLVTEVVPIGGGSYQVVDVPLTAGVTFFYQLSERLTHLEERVLGATSGVPLEYIIHVDADALGANDGTSWANAFVRLVDGLGVTLPGCQVWVAEGTYQPALSGGSRSASFDLTNGVRIYGGFAANETLLAQRNPALNVTTLSGDLNGDDNGLLNRADNSFHVARDLTTVSTAAFDGFVIRAGNADGAGDDGRGAGMFSLGGGAALTGCTLIDNHSVGEGGGAYFGANAFAVVRDCVIQQSSAASGGGVHCAGSNALFVRCSFLGNSATDGGGAHVASGDTSAFVNCDFRANVASVRGGAVAGSGDSAQFVGCWLTGDTADHGAAFGLFNSACTILNASVLGNSATTDGGGVWIDTGAPTITNTLAWSNSDAGGRGQGAQLHVVAGAPTVNWSCIQGWTGALGGTGNHANNPQLAHPAGVDAMYGTEDDDPRVSPGSGAIDAGDDNQLAVDVADLDVDQDVLEPMPLDTAGHAREIDDPATVDTGGGISPLADIGAFEFEVDCNGNSVLDSLDLSSLTSLDCNANGLPDECDVAQGYSRDLNGNLVPDECELVGTPFCFCATTGPCGNNDPAAGCANSTGHGALLIGYGSASVSADDLNFLALNMTGNAAVVFCGPDSLNGGNGLVFGDGRRCAGGTTIRRLGLQTVSFSGSATWGPGLHAGFGAWASGVTMRFQAWYRNAAGTPCNGLTNVSNALEVVFTP